MIFIGMYRIFQFFVLALKVDIFTEFLVSLFYLIQFFSVPSNEKNWNTWVQLTIAILLLPTLYFARTAVSLLQRYSIDQLSHAYQIF